MYKLLPWDSTFFGLRVAAITNPQIQPVELGLLLQKSRLDGVELVYWPSDIRLDESTALALGGYLVDIKVTFGKCLAAANAIDISTSRVRPGPYSPGMPAADLELLAIQSGQYSRFSADPRIGRDKFEALYRLWIHRSLTKSIAHEVLVIQDGARVVGMVTLTEINGRGNIGLVAVESGYRGRGYGEALIRGADTWFQSNGFSSVQVVTQDGNVSARRLYKRCSYSVERTEFFYHFWL